MPGKWFITNLSSSAGIQPEDKKIGGCHLSKDTRIKGYSLRSDQGYSVSENKDTGMKRDRGKGDAEVQEDLN